MEKNNENGLRHEAMKMQGKGIADVLKACGCNLPGPDSELYQDIASKMSDIRLSLLVRKKLAKSLSVDEKKALGWKTVRDAFMCLDTSRLAREYPHDAAGIVRTVACVLSLIFPFFLPISAALAMMKDADVAKIAVYCGTPTPEHIMAKISDARVMDLSMSENEAHAVYENQMKKE